MYHPLNGTPVGLKSWKKRCTKVFYKRTLLVNWLQFLSSKAQDVFSVFKFRDHEVLKAPTLLNSYVGPFRSIFIYAKSGRIGQRVKTRQQQRLPYHHSCGSTFTLSTSLSLKQSQMKIIATLQEASGLACSLSPTKSSLPLPESNWKSRIFTRGPGVPSSPLSPDSP